MRQILCFGDSNTWGYDPETGKRYPWGVRWTSLLQDKLGHEGARVIEEGLCGRTSVFEDELRAGRRGIEALPLLLESHAPLDLVIVMLGTNDCKTIYHTNETIIGKGIEQILQTIKRIQPQAEILLVSPIHLGDNVWKPEFDPEFDQKSIETSVKLKNVYKKLAEQYEIHFLAASEYVAYSEADQEHMNAASHKKFAEVIYDAIKSINRS